MNTKSLHSRMISTIVAFSLIYIYFTARTPSLNFVGIVGFTLAFPVATLCVALHADALKKHSIQGFVSGMCGARLTAYVWALWVFGKRLLQMQTNEMWITCIACAVCIAMDTSSLGRLRTK